MTNLLFASTKENNETDTKLNESIALAHHFKEFSNQPKGTNWRSVGAGGCQYSSIQAAIDEYTQSALGMIGIPIEFRIATNKTYFENIVIGGNYDISLTGGYSDCTNMAGIPGSNQVLINAANNSGVVLKVQDVITRRTMVFKNLRLINGNNAAGAGGGLLSDNSNVSLLLENIDIRNNTASHGAGIAIVGGDTDLLMNESLVLGNVADYGGGIYCSGGTSSVNVANQSGIISNIANGTAAFPSGRGGGSYIDGCYFAIFTGSANNGSFTGMEGNSSISSGGAIYARNAIIRLHGHQSCGSLGCLGDDINPVSFRSNQSNLQGGAVISAVGSDVRINGTWMEGNTGFSIIDASGGLTLERFQQPCWRNSECNLFENNSGIIIAASFGDISISNTTFKNNPDGVFLISGASFSSDYISANIESNFFFQNGSFLSPGSGTYSTMRFSGALDVSYIHNTIVDNSSIDSTFLFIWTTDFGGQKPTFEAHSNIIDNPGSSLLIHHEISGNASTLDVNISALITNETDSLLEINGVFNDAINFAGGDFITETIPGEVLFIDRANGNLHLSENSRAIDYFNTPSRATVTYKDMDFEDRGYDDPNNQSPISSLFHYDIGADERNFMPELIFTDGFE
jgi:predicted outer membrane repeat protein